MKWQEFKIFLKYQWEGMNPKNYLKNPNFYKWILIALLLYSVFFSDLKYNQKLIVTIAFCISLLFIEKYVEYIGGYWRHWWREKQGIPSRGEIKRAKERLKKESEIERRKIGN